jgi:aspartokinase/homoserine dehydrogenase 1
MNVLVHKFGGAALRDAAAIRHAAEIVASYRARPSVVVTSALAGVTDLLFAQDVNKVRKRHLTVLRDLELDPQLLDEMLEGLERRVGESRSPEAIDEMLAYGERMSVRIFGAVLESRGIRASVVDGAAVIHTDGRHGNAAPDLQKTQVAVREGLTELSNGAVVVMAGFIGVAPDGSTVTLGRGGSDLSATVVGRALGAEDVYLWKDVPGFLTADPRVVPTARVVEHLSAREAAELAYYGAKVLHPRALTPLHARTRLYVRPFANPESQGTEITIRAPSSGSPVRALSAIRRQALVTVTGNGMLGVPGIAARTFGALANAAISVSLISQASSEHSICFAVGDGEADAARTCLLAAFATELQRREIERIDVRTGLATLAVVGAGMARTPGISARIFSTLGENAINIVAIAQGSSEINISIVVDEERVADAQRAIHAAFQLDKRTGGGRVRRSERADVVLLGFGRIGRELVSHAAHADVRSRLRIVGVIDRSGYVFDARGISDRRLAAAALAKRRGQGLADFPGGVRSGITAALAEMGRHALTRPIVVDATASDTHKDLTIALTRGMDVVLANKLPLTVGRDASAALFETAARFGRRVLCEATVGAGLPIIDTYEKLVASGDRVLTIEGCPSGTLGYVLGKVGLGTPFSVALSDAIAAGYTEADPRDDLSGRDVARKALILGRLLGFTGELADVATESLVPESLGEIAVADFLERLPEVDVAWAERVECARQSGEVLRYRATATQRSVRVGIVSVPLASALGSLVGTDNQFVFTTKRYRDNPLIIIGPGAGPAVTAQGVLNDILKLAESRERPAGRIGRSERRSA